jgi:cyclophilin family peptidyl-prolyl cis-trans isomerase
MTKAQKILTSVGAILGVFIVTGLIIWSGMRLEKTNTNSTTNINAMTYAFPGVLPESRIANKKAVITTSKGVIEFTLNSEAAPKSVSNFVYLAELGFYNGLTFHRVESGFVIQGGDPSGNGTGGPGYQFPDEPVKGEYIEGAVAMANSGTDTNGSQFFITLADVSKTLAKNYNLFGQVTKGMDVVKSIAVGDVMQSVKIESR